MYMESNKIFGRAKSFYQVMIGLYFFTQEGQPHALTGEESAEEKK